MPAIAACLLLLALLAVSCASLTEPSDVTARLQRLGNPARTSYPDDAMTFARNAWVLHPFAGRLYIGLGNRDNAGPAPNAGPVDIWRFDPAAGSFDKEWTAPDEQIEQYREFDGELVIPGNDPQEDWTLGNFYRRDAAGVWSKLRTIPNGIHTFDMAQFDGVLYAALGAEYGAVVVASRDRGASWQPHPLQRNRGPIPSRAHAFLAVGGRLYVSTVGREARRMFLLDGGGFREVPAAERDFFPGFAPNDGIAAYRATPFRGHLAYFAARKLGGRNAEPLAMFVAAADASVRRVELPEGLRPRDLAVAGDRLLLLAERRLPDGATQSDVLASRDLATWRPLLQFRTPTFVRAFAALGDDLYFGLGSDNNDVRPETGDILRLSGAAR